MAAGSTDDALLDASVFDKEAIDALIAHGREEEEVITAYEALARTTRSGVVRYLVGLIVEDERRHHRVFEQLANTLRAQATLVDARPRLPQLDVHRFRDRALLEATRHFLELERQDRARLDELQRRVRDTGDELDAFVIGLLRSDSERHVTILGFIEHLVRTSPLR